MTRFMIIWLTILGFGAAVSIDPYEFWIDAEPYYPLACGYIFLFCISLLFWIYTVVSNRKSEDAVALTAYINTLTEQQRRELAEPDSTYECNSGILHWKATASQSRMACLMPTRPPLYAKL